MHDEEFHNLESRLRADATRLTQAITPAVVSPQQLLTHHKQQRAARLRIRVVGSITLALVVSGIWWSMSHPRFEAPSPGPQLVKSPVTPKVDPKPGPASPVASAASAKTDKNQAALASLKRLTEAGALPVMLLRTDANGKPVLVPGLYVPPRRQRVEFRQLKPVQQRAILTVLGMPVHRHDSGI